MKLLIISDAHTDLIFGEQISEKILSGETELSEEIYPYGAPQLGGAGANTARSAAALGVETALLAVNGTDPFTESRKRTLESYGIDTSLLLRHPNPGLTAPAAVSHGERIFLKPLNLDRIADNDLRVENIDCEKVLSYDMVYSCGIHLFDEPIRTSVLTVLRWFHDAGKPVVFDCNLRVGTAEFADQNRRDFYDVFSMCHTVSGSGAEELCVITGESTIGEACRKILSLGCKTVIAKLGAGGADLYNKDGVLHCPAMKVPVRDTLGAGDTFAGGYLSGLADGLSEEGCLRRATLAAAYEIQHEGTSTMGNIDQLEALDNRFGPLKITG